MTIEQTVEIPASHRLIIDVPLEIPEGRTIISFTPVQGHSSKEQQHSPLPGGCCGTVEEALQAAAEKAADPNRKPISWFFGTLSPSTYGDGVAYQRELRDEWG